MERTNKEILWDNLVDTYHRGIIAETWLKQCIFDCDLDSQFDLSEMEPWYGMGIKIGGITAEVDWNLDVLIEYSRTGITMREMIEKEDFPALSDFQDALYFSGATMMNDALFDIIGDCKMYEQFEPNIFHYVFYEDALKEVDFEGLCYIEDNNVTYNWFTYSIQDFTKYLP